MDHAADRADHAERSAGEGGGPFDARMAEWVAWQATPWGRLYFRLLAHTLEPAVETLGAGVRVLDVGGADGRNAIRLARNGHVVTILDHSSELLHRAEDTARSCGAIARVRTRCADIGRLRDPAFVRELDGGAGGFDVVLCHNVLPYVRDAVGHIRLLVGAMRPGGLISLVAPNPAMDVLARAVRETDPAGARALLASPSVRSHTFDREMRRVSVAEGEAGLRSAGCRVTARFGLRCVMDLIADDAMKHDPARFAELERLEIDLCDREPYLRMARFWHLIGTRGSAP